MLEPYERKLSRTVLRRGRASNCSFLFNIICIFLSIFTDSVFAGKHIIPDTKGIFVK